MSLSSLQVIHGDVTFVDRTSSSAVVDVSNSVTQSSPILASTTNTATSTTITQPFGENFTVQFYQACNSDMENVCSDYDHAISNGTFQQQHRFEFVKFFLQPEVVVTTNTTTIISTATNSVIDGKQRLHKTQPQLPFASEQLLIKPSSISRVFTEAWLRGLLDCFLSSTTTTHYHGVSDNTTLHHQQQQPRSKVDVIFDDFENMVRSKHMRPIVFQTKMLLSYYFLPDLSDERKRLFSASNNKSSSSSSSSSCMLRSGGSSSMLRSRTGNNGDHTNHSICTTTSSLMLQLPADVWLVVATHCSIKDMYHVTLTCSTLRHTLRSQWGNIRQQCIPPLITDSVNGLASWMFLNQSNALFLNQQRAVIRHPISKKYVGAMHVGKCVYINSKNSLRHVASGQIISWKDVMFQNIKINKLSKHIFDVGFHHYACDLHEVDGYSFWQYYFVTLSCQRLITPQTLPPNKQEDKEDVEDEHTL
jgi:hypothetical protein